MKLHKAIQLTNAMIHKMNAAPSAITKTFSMNIENKTRSIELSKWWSNKTQTLYFTMYTIHLDESGMITLGQNIATCWGNKISCI